MLYSKLKSVIIGCVMGMGLLAPITIHAQVEVIDNPVLINEEGNIEIMQFLEGEELSLEQVVKAFKGYEAGEVALERIGTYIDEPHLDAKIDTLMGDNPEQRFKTREGVLEWIRSEDGVATLQFLEAMLEAERQENLEKALSLEPTESITANTLELGTTETIKIQSNTPQAPEPIHSVDSAIPFMYLIYAMPVLGLVIGVVGGRYYLSKQADTGESDVQNSIDNQEDSEDLDDSDDLYTELGIDKSVMTGYTKPKQTDRDD